MAQECLRERSLAANPTNILTMTVALSSTPLTKSESRSFVTETTSTSLPAERLESVLSTDSLRTPASTGNLISSGSVVQSKVSFRKVSQVTPSEGGYGSYVLSDCADQSLENGNSIATTTTSSHPVSRRGGRFVSPSQRGSCSSSGKDLEDDKSLPKECIE
jgi:hypothetical protein